MTLTTQSALAREVGISRQAINDAINKNVIPHVLVNGKKKIDLDDPVVKNYIKGNCQRSKKKKVVSQPKKKENPRPKKQGKTNEEILIDALDYAIANNVDGDIMQNVKSDLFEYYQSKRIKSFVEKNEIKIHTEFMKVQYSRISEAEEIGLPSKENEQIRFITTSQLNVISFIFIILERLGAVDEIVLSYYVIGLKTIDFIDQLLSNGLIGKIFLQTSTLRLHGKDQKAIDRIRELIKKHGRKKIGCNLAFTHTKILGIRKNDDHYVIEGSGNLSDNARIEQYLFEKSKSTFEFHSEWIKNVEKYSAKKDVVVL